MTKAKGKGGTGRGTGKKGWTRWEKGANKAKSNKPYTSKHKKNAAPPKADNAPKSEEPGWIDG